MFDRVVPLLLRGEFVCDVQYPDEYRYLTSDQARVDVNAFLERLGRRLATTRTGAAFYCAYVSLGDDERKAIRQEFTEIKQLLQPFVHFLVLVMKATRSDEVLAPGAIIEVNQLRATIDDNPSLQSDLQVLAALTKGRPGDGSHRGHLDRILRQLKDEGYLALVNPEREIYRITGKSEYLTTVVDYLVEHEVSVDQEEEESSPGTLV